LKINELKPISY